MCLYVDEKETRLIKRRFAAAKKMGKNYIVCYKELLNRRGYSPYYLKMYKPGWNKSNRKSTKLTKYEKEYIGKGIHVVSTSRGVIDEDYEKKYIIPIRCYKKDFVSGGEFKEAVFTKIFITRKDYDKFIRKNS